jgi:phosphatidate cytidylyltransferase
MTTGMKPRAGLAAPRPPAGLRARVKAMRERFVFQRELRLRLFSAAVLIPLVLVATYLDEVSFAMIVALTGALVLYEWLRMIGAGHLVTLRWVGWIGLVVVAATALTQPTFVALATIPLLVVAAAIAAWRHRFYVAVRWVSAGILYASVAIVALVELRKGDDGFGAVVFVFLVAWATDTAAFFVGRKLGGPKLWRRVSPSKTWSGAIGGLVAGTLFGAVVALFIDDGVTVAALGTALVVAVAAEAGDLLESAAKRRFSVKDAGTLIPGHGGVMDRVDGVILASLVTVLIGTAMAADTPAAGLIDLIGR